MLNISIEEVATTLRHPGPRLKGFAAWTHRHSVTMGALILMFGLAQPGDSARKEGAGDEPAQTWEGRPEAWSDFAHAIVDPLTEMHREEVAESSPLLEPIREAMSRQGLTEWADVVNEHIVRSLTVVLTRHLEGEAAAAETLRRDVESGFIYMPALVRYLDEYHRTWSVYPALADGYPAMLEVLNARVADQSARTRTLEEFEGTEPAPPVLAIEGESEAGS